MVSFGNCGAHYYCGECLGKHIEELVNEGQVSQVTCPSLECEATVSEEDVRQLLSTSKPAVYDRYLRFMILALLDQEQMLWCPNSSCGAPVLAAELDVCPGFSSAGALLCVCPACNTRFCSKCSRDYHPGVDCEGASHDPEFARWLASQQSLVKECFACGRPVEKNQGCNHITCRCGKQWCWLCQLPYEHGHFSLPSRCGGLQFAAFNSIIDVEVDRMRTSLSGNPKSFLKQVKSRHRQEFHTWCHNNPPSVRLPGRRKLVRTPEQHAELALMTTRHEQELQIASGHVASIDVQIQAFIDLQEPLLRAAFEEAKAKERAAQVSAAPSST